MKKIKLLTILLLLNLSAFSQIDPFEGIANFDSCKFESQCGLYKPDTSSQNIWQIGKPAKPFFDTAYSQPNALVTDTINPYPNANHSYFDLRIRNLYVADMIVGFKHKYQTDTLTDGGYIEISYDKGQTWINVIHSDTTAMMFFTENLYSNQDTLKGGINGFSGSSNGWIYTRIEWVWVLPCKIYPPDTLIMRFHFISDSIQTNKAGWMIDNIIISYAVMTGSIKEMNTDMVSINISPNPMTNFTTIRFDNRKNEKLTLRIFNTLGQIAGEIEDVTDNQIQIEKGDLTSGLYFVQLRNKQKIIGITKLVVK